ncbi:hypothetical protein WDU94_007644 [Cyamophila willieti]
MNIFKPRPDVSPHLLRRFLTLCHVCGLISIPNYYREPWKTRYHSYFSKCVFIYFNIFLVCIALSVFINAIHDFGEFCMRFLEFLCLFIVHSELIYFRRNLGKFYELLTLIEGLARDHGHHPVVGRTQKMQKFFLYSSLLFMYNVIVGSKLLQTVLPVDESTLARTKRIYNYEYPQHTFIVPIYIGIDTSPSRVYWASAMCLLFMDVALVPTIMLTVAFFWILAHDVKAFVGILSNHITHIGEQHQNEFGQQVYYTNLLRNKYVVRDHSLPNVKTTTKVLPEPIIVVEASTIDMNQASTSKQVTLPNQPISIDKINMIDQFDINQDAYDYFYVKQIVLFQKHLLDLTDKVCNMFHVLFGLFNFSDHSRRGFTLQASVKLGNYSH